MELLSCCCCPNDYSSQPQRAGLHFWSARRLYLHFEVIFHFFPFREHCECGKPWDKICWIGKNCQRVSRTRVPLPEPQARCFAGVRSSVKSGKLQTCSDMEFRSFCLSVLIRIYNCDQKVSSKNFIWCLAFCKEQDLENLLYFSSCHLFIYFLRRNNFFLKIIGPHIDSNKRYEKRAIRVLEDSAR